MSLEKKAGASVSNKILLVDDEKDSVDLYFPVHVSKVTMYVNGEQFTGSKAILLPILSALLLLVLISGVLYGLFTTKAMKRLTAAAHEIAVRSYLPTQDHGVFHDLYDSLNTLDAEIRASDHLRAQTEKMREAWIAIITHDLKSHSLPSRGIRRSCGKPAAGTGSGAAVMQGLC